MRLLLLPFFLLFCACDSADEASSSGGPPFRCNGDDLFTTSDADWLIGQWQTAGTRVGAPADRYEFSREPRRVVVENTRQVGSEDDPDVPYPTLCGYRYTAEAFCVFASDETNVRGKVYEIEYQVSNAQLLDTFDNPPACDAFLAQQQAEIDGNGLRYSLDLIRGEGDTLTIDDMGMQKQ